jgi:hypothetical protein
MTRSPAQPCRTSAAATWRLPPALAATDAAVGERQDHVGGQLPYEYRRHAGRAGCPQQGTESVRQGFRLQEHRQGNAEPEQPDPAAQPATAAVPDARRQQQPAPSRLALAVSVASGACGGELNLLSIICVLSCDGCGGLVGAAVVHGSARATPESGLLGCAVVARAMKSTIRAES